MKKWLLGFACVGLLATAAMDAMGGLIISQYYEGTSNNKWIEIYNPGPGSVDLIGGGYRLGRWDNLSAEAWKTGTAPNGTIILTNVVSLAAGDTYLVKNGSATLPAYATAEQSSGAMTFNENDSVVLYTGATYDFANVVDAFGMGVAFSNAIDRSYVRKNTITAGVNTDFNAADWDEFTLAAVESAAATSNEYLGYHNTGGGGGSTSVYFFASAAAVDENAGTYQVTVYKSVAEGDMAGTVTLSGTAAEGIGADYTIDTTNFTLNGTTTSAVLTVTINDDGDSEAAETIVMDLANVTGAATGSPSTFTLTINASDIASHTIAIVTNTPADGTVTTTPAGTAAEGQTVTITATPVDGYRVASIVVVDGAANPVAVAGNTFVMPTSDATVTVTFEVYDAPSAIIDFEDYSASSYIGHVYSNAATHSAFYMTNVVSSSLANDRTIDAKSARFYNYRSSGSAAIMQQIGAFTSPVSKISFWYADYGTDTAASFKVQVSANGTDWTDVGDAAYDPAGTTMVESVISSLPANTIFLQFTTLGTSAQRVNIDNIGLWYGTATYGVTFDKTEGFTIDQGTLTAIVATAANGTAPYAYSWSSTLGEGYRTSESNVFTILTSATNGNYSATVVATDSDAPAKSVTNTINFSVVPPAAKYPIAISTNPVVGGTVTTIPAGEAEAGQTVAIAATPASGFVVGAITATESGGGTALPIVGNSFVMTNAGVMVSVTFDAFVPKSLIISEVADPSDNANARFVEIYNAGASSIDLAAGTWYLARQANGGATWGNIALTGTVAAGSTYIVAGNASNYLAAYPAAPVPNQASGNIDGNGNDGYFLYSGGKNTNGMLEDAYGVVNQDGSSNAWYYADRRAYRNAGVVQGNPTWTASEWTIPASAAVADMTPGVHPEGAVPLSVSVDKTNGFTVIAGGTDAITATAANGNPPYTYAWITDMAPGGYTNLNNVFTITAAAPTGSFFATVVAMDSLLAAASNTVTFSVVGGGGGDVWTIGDGTSGSDMFYTTSNRTITIIMPTNYGLYAVYGTDSSSAGLNNLGQGGLTPLAPGLDYTWTPASRTVSILSGVTNRRVFRIGATNSP